jgi:adenylate kinase family enzyme
MKKIIIIGPSGAGKTILAQVLSKKLAIPHVELDSINHQANWQPIDKDIFRSKVNSITAQDSWIFCGNYFSILGIDFWKQADTIIWCDYSFPVVLGRLLRRTVRRVFTRQILWNENKEMFTVNFLSYDSVILWMMREWNNHKKNYGLLFSQPETLPGINLVRLKSPRATNGFLENIY